MRREEIVVALDLGTTKVCALVAEVARDQQIEVLGIGVAPCQGLRKGVVVDIPATIRAIQDAVEEASRQARVQVATVFVDITGNHIQSVNNRGAVMVQNEISEEHVREARLAAQRMELDNHREVIHNLTRQFIVDGVEGIRHPVGMSGRQLEVETHVITAGSSFVENIVKCVQGAGLEIEAIVVEPLATGLAVLTEAERSLGVALADIGGGTTDVALFHEGVIALTEAIPVGGNHVTQDLTVAFRLDPEQAERIKVRHAAARLRDVDPGEYIEVQMVGEDEPREIPRRLLPEITGPRMSQIFELLDERIARAREQGIYVATTVLSGGAAQMPGTVELAQEILQMPVRLGRPRALIDPQGLAASPIHSTAAGMLHYASERLPGRRRVPEPQGLAASAARRVLGWLRRLGRS